VSCDVGLDEEQMARNDLHPGSIADLRSRSVATGGTLGVRLGSIEHALRPRIDRASAASPRGRAPFLFNRSEVRGADSDYG
jgi:hypothetical protein